MALRPATASIPHNLSRARTSCVRRSASGQTATCPPKWAMSALPQIPEAMADASRVVSPGSDINFPIRERQNRPRFLDKRLIGPPRALRREGDDLVNHDRVEHAENHQGVRDGQHHIAMLTSALPRQGRTSDRRRWRFLTSNARDRAARRLMSVAEAYRSKSDTILHGHSNGARQLGDGGSAEETFETGRQTSVLCSEHVVKPKPQPFGIPAMC
jgi:hypothetical protein